MLIKFKRSINTLFLFFSALILCVQFSYGQERDTKINTIIDSLKLIESQKLDLIKYGLDILKYEASEEDMIKITEIENQLTDQEIRKRIFLAFEEVLSDKEINDLYDFINSSAFDKLFNSTLYVGISNNFNDISTEIDKISRNIEENNDPTPKFKPIPIEREDGFYAAIEYSPYMDDKDIIFEKEPSIKIEDISEVKKSMGNYGNTDINIILTKNGGEKFYILTKINIGNPIAIVVDKHIISMPIVHDAISGGKVSITGNFSDEEIENIIQKLNNK